MKRIAFIILLLVCVWQASRPKNIATLQSIAAITKELGSELHSTLVDEPIEQARKDFIKGAEKRVMEEEKANIKKIDAAIEKIERGEAGTHD